VDEDTELALGTYGWVWVWVLAIEVGYLPRVTSMRKSNLEFATGRYVNATNFVLNQFEMY